MSKRTLGPQSAQFESVVFRHPQPGAVVTGIQGCAPILVSHPLENLGGHRFNDSFPGRARVRLSSRVERVKSIAFYVGALDDICAPTSLAVYSC